MAKRSKKKQNAATLLAATALTVSTVAPYAVSAEELANENLVASSENLDTTSNNDSSGTPVEAPTDLVGGNSGASSDGETTGDSNTPVTPTLEQPTGDFDNLGDVKVLKDLTHSFTAVEVQAGIFGSVPGSFIENYLAPYFTNSQLVEVDGKKYIQMTLVKKGYGVKSFEGGEFVYQKGTAMDQVRVLRIPAAAQSSHDVDAGDYGIYELTFSFDVTAEDLADKPVDPTPVDPTPVDPDSGDGESTENPEVVKGPEVYGLNDVVKTYSITASYGGALDYNDGYFNKDAVLAITKDNKKYIQLTINPSWKKFLKSIAVSDDSVVKNSTFTTDSNNNGYILLEVASFDTINASIPAMDVKEGTITFPNISDEYNENDITNPDNGDGETTSPVDPGTPEEPTPVEPESPVQTAPVESIEDIPTEDTVQLVFNVGTTEEAPPALAAFTQVLQQVQARRIDNKIQVTIPMPTASSIQRVEAWQNNKKIGEWIGAGKPVASLRTFMATANNALQLEVDSLDNISFKVYEDSTNEEPIAVAVTKVEKVVAISNENNGDEQPQQEVGHDLSLLPGIEPSEFIQNLDYTMVADPDGEMPDFITNYLNPYFSDAKLVKVKDEYFVEIKLTGKSYSYNPFRYFDLDGNQHDITIVSSVGEKMDQVRIARIPLIYNEDGITKVFVNSSAGYGSYVLFFDFEKPDFINKDEGETPTEPEKPGNENGSTTPGGNTGNSVTPTQPTNPGGSTAPEFNNSGQVAVDKSVSHSFTAQEVQAGKYGSVPGSFIENYLAPYFTNAQLVTVNGSKYIQMTLIGKGYGVKSFGGGTFVSSTGSGLDQVRVLRIPAAKQSTHRVDAGDYGIYDLTFSFGVTDDDLANTSGNTTGGDGSSTKPEENKPTDAKPQVVDVESTGDADMKLALTEENKALSTIINKFSTQFKDGKFNVKISLTNTNNVKQLIVKQNGKEIARWNNPKTTAYVASLFGAKLASTATELAFDVASLEGLTVEAVTDKGSLTGAIQATSKVEAQKPQLADGEIAYSIHPDPTDDAGEFIVNYLKPYFSKAKEVVIDGKQYIEMTITGKAYGFEKIQYADATGKLQDVTIVSKTGEKMDQVRVIRLPLVKDAKGFTKLFVDSGDLGYGAYNLLFDFDVEVKGEASGETNTNTESKPSNPEEKPTTPEEKPAIKNPFKDIDKSGFKDDILAIYAAGITTGTTKTTFSPNKNITRAQFAVMIARALDLSPTKATQFKDIKGKSYENAVQALYEAGIVTGVNAETFNPGKEITRQQAAAMIYRMLTYKGFKGSATAADLNFKDVNKVQSYAKLALAELQKQQIMTGSNGYIKASDNLTRGQMAKVLKRSLELIGFEF